MIFWLDRIFIFFSYLRRDCEYGRDSISSMAEFSLCMATRRKSWILWTLVIGACALTARERIIRIIIDYYPHWNLACSKPRWLMNPQTCLKMKKSWFSRKWAAWKRKGCASERKKNDHKSTHTNKQKHPMKLSLRFFFIKSAWNLHRQHLVHIVCVVVVHVDLLFRAPPCTLPFQTPKRSEWAATKSLSPSTTFI